MGDMDISHAPLNSATALAYTLEINGGTSVACSDLDAERTLGPGRRCLVPCCIVTGRRRRHPRGSLSEKLCAAFPAAQ
jgi:hypothetical protein